MVYHTRKILVIEDDAEDVLVLQENLEKTGLDFKLQTIHTGREAIPYLQEISKNNPRTYPDLIILDLHLPDLDGTEVLRMIRLDPHLFRIPIIAYTGLDDEQINKCYASGVNCCIEKPKSLEEAQKLAESIEGFWFSTSRLPSDCRH